MQSAPAPLDSSPPGLDVSAIVICRDDEDHVGHRIRRLHDHLLALGVRAEILAVDESSTDNTLALLSLLRKEIPSLSVVAGVAAGRGFILGASLARGHALLLVDARSDAPLSALGFALGRVTSGLDGIAVHGRYLVLRRTRALPAFDSLFHRRDATDLHRRFLRRARALGLRTDVAAARDAGGTWNRLREALLVPLTSRAWW